MNTTLKKVISVIASAAFLTASSAVGVFAADGVDYKINSTYQNVDWSAYNQYKADLHGHSTASDGGQSKKETIETHYGYGFDIMALTDHGTVDSGWDTLSSNRIIRIGTVIKNGNRSVEPLFPSGITADGKKYTYENDYYRQYGEDGSAGHAMLRVPFGNEQNPTSFNNAHVNTWFVDYGHNVLGGTSDYITPIKNADELGGLSVINHPGEYSGARDEACFEDAYDMDNIHYRYVVNKFANILTSYNSCLGIDINSKGDFRTRYDRKLWDLLLQKAVPTGRNVYAIATSDSHAASIVNSGYTVMLMPELTQSALRASMENGEFFAASRYIGSREELNAWACELKEAGKGGALASELEQAVNAIYAEEAQGKQQTIYQFDENAEAPKVTGVYIDEADDTITINTRDAYMVHWVADGEFIASGNTIDLDDYSDKIGSYVRAEIIGEGGVLYSQAFTLEYDGAPQASQEKFVDFGCAASFICDGIVRLLANILEYCGIVDFIWMFIK